jgi:hypothetical protein
MRIYFFGALVMLMLLSGCHGSSIDSAYPGEYFFGHSEPPAVNLPPQDAGMEYR